MPGFALMLIIGCGWIGGTIIASIASERDQFTPQVKWLGNIVTGPFKFGAELLGAPKRLLNDYWQHKEKMKQLDPHTDKRLSALELEAVERLLNEDD